MCPNVRNIYSWTWYKSCMCLLQFESLTLISNFWVHCHIHNIPLQAFTWQCSAQWGEIIFVCASKISFSRDILWSNMIKTYVLSFYRSKMISLSKLFWLGPNYFSQVQIRLLWTNLYNSDPTKKIWTGPKQIGHHKQLVLDQNYLDP